MYCTPTVYVVVYSLCVWFCGSQTMLRKRWRRSDKHFLSNTDIALTTAQNTVNTVAPVPLKVYYKCHYWSWRPFLQIFSRGIEFSMQPLIAIGPPARFYARKASLVNVL